MSNYLEELYDQIDASLFSGDSFYDVDEYRRLEHFIARWRRGLDEITPIHKCSICGSMCEMKDLVDNEHYCKGCERDAKYER